MKLLKIIASDSASITVFIKWKSLLLQRPWMIETYRVGTKFTKHVVVNAVLRTTAFLETLEKQVDELDFLGGHWVRMAYCFGRS
jgi:hypothetical protein